MKLPSAPMVGLVVAPAGVRGLKRLANRGGGNNDLSHRRGAWIETITNLNRTCAGGRLAGCGLKPLERLECLAMSRRTRRGGLKPQWLANEEADDSRPQG